MISLSVSREELVLLPNYLDDFYYSGRFRHIRNGGGGHKGLGSRIMQYSFLKIPFSFSTNNNGIGSEGGHTPLTPQTISASDQ